MTGFSKFSVRLESDGVSSCILRQKKSCGSGTNQFEQVAEDVTELRGDRLCYGAEWFELRFS